MENTIKELSQFNLSGNIVHSQWFKTIQRNGKADLLAINILSEIVYWYKPVEVRDELTGQHIGYKKKYKADALQKSYDAFANLFGVSKRQVTDAVIRLEELGVIRREFRTVKEGNMVLNNVLFIHLNTEKLKEISYPSCENVDTPITKKCDPYHEKKGDLSRKNVTPITQKRDTNTETTTEITTEREEKNPTPQKTKTKKQKQKKIEYGDFVKLTKAEYKKLCKEFGGRVITEYIEKVDNYIGSSGRKYKSHYHTIRVWLNNDGIRPMDMTRVGNSAQDRLNAEMEEAKKILGLID